MEPLRVDANGTFRLPEVRDNQTLDTSNGRLRLM